MRVLLDRSGHVVRGTGGEVSVRRRAPDGDRARLVLEAVQERRAVLRLEGVARSERQREHAALAGRAEELGRCGGRDHGRRATRGGGGGGSALLFLADVRVEDARGDTERGGRDDVAHRDRAAVVQVVAEGVFGDVLGPCDGRRRDRAIVVRDDDVRGCKRPATRVDRGHGGRAHRVDERGVRDVGGRIDAALVRVLARDPAEGERGGRDPRQERRERVARLEGLAERAARARGGLAALGDHDRGGEDGGERGELVAAHAEERLDAGRADLRVRAGLMAEHVRRVAATHGLAVVAHRTTRAELVRGALARQVAHEVRDLASVVAHVDERRDEGPAVEAGHAVEHERHDGPLGGLDRAAPAPVERLVDALLGRLLLERDERGLHAGFVGERDFEDAKLGGDGGGGGGRSRGGHGAVLGSAERLCPGILMIASLDSLSRGVSCTHLKLFTCVTDQAMLRPRADSQGISFPCLPERGASVAHGTMGERFAFSVEPRT